MGAFVTFGMTFGRILFASAISLAALAATPAGAAVTFAGSWEVDSGPNWASAPPNGPLAYSGQEAAALLFGGSASQYVISTVDNNVADINNQAWYSVIGLGGGHMFADNYSDKYLGQFYGPTSGYPFGDLTAPASAYVDDNAVGADFTNFAFRVSGVPEPATWTMLILGFGGIGMMLRRRRQEIPAR